MPLFVVIPTEDGTPAWKEEAKRLFLTKCYELPRGEVLVAYDGTSNQLSDALGISDGSKGSGIVAGIGSYWGYASKHVWEWISVNEK